MKINLYPYDFDLDFTNHAVQTLIINHHTYYSKFILSLYNLSNGLDSEEVIRVSIKNKLVPFDKHVLLVTDLFYDICSNKKVINQLYSTLELAINDDLDKRHKIDEYYSNIIHSIQPFLYDYNFNLEYGTSLSLPQLFKLMNLKIELEATTIYEQIFNIIEINHHFKLYPLIIFVNIKLLLNSNEFEEIMKYCNSKNQYLLFVENKDYNEYKDYKVLIDQDYEDYIIDNH